MSIPLSEAFFTGGIWGARTAIRSREVFTGFARILSGGAVMSKNENRVKITLVCSECKQRNYNTEKNKKNDPDRLEMKKFCPFCRKQTLHKESK